MTSSPEIIDLESAVLPDAILGDMSRADFFTTYWRRRFLHLPRAAAGLLELMPTLDDVEALLDGPAHLDADLAHFLSFPPAGVPVTRQWTVATRDAQRRDRREPVNLIAAERSFPRLYPLASALQRSFGSPASLQLFWGPTGGAVNPHRDTNDSFVIQICGSKRWLGTDVTDEHPKVSGVTGADFVSEPRVFDLEPGDVLYKPSHAVHSTSSADETTLSLTCSIVTRTAGDLVLEALRQRMLVDPAWLERFPLVDDVEHGDDDRARPRIEAALATLATYLPSIDALNGLARS